MNRQQALGDSFWSRYGCILAAVWVIFLIFPILTITESTLELPARLAGYGLIAMFGVIYVWGFFTYSAELGVNAGGFPRAWIPFGGLVLVAGLSTPLLRGDVISLGPFLISFAAYLLSVRTMWLVDTLVLAVSFAVAVNSGTNDYIFLLGLMAVLVVVNAINTMLIRQNMAAVDLRLDYAVLAEQERMARDVHDALGHSLTAVGLKAQLAERLLDTDSEAARAELQQINALTHEALDSIRATVGGLRRTSLEEELATVRAVLDDAGVSTVLVGESHDIDPVRSTALAWILREAVTNVVRHAHATTCWITMNTNSLGIEDDGDSLAGSHKGHGMRGMHERARLNGANCEIGDSVHGGTKVGLSW